MQPIEFKGFNTVFAKDQPEYLPLPAHVNRHDTAGTVTTCWRLTWRERLRVLLKGQVWLQQLTFHKPLQPQRPSIECPIDVPHEPIKYQPKVAANS